MTITTTAPITEEAPAGLPAGRVKLVFVVVLVATLLSALDQTIVSTALPTIVGDLGGGGHLSWVVSAYLLADTVSTVLAGKLGDLFGRKRLLLVSTALFVVASATCGMAQGMTWLILWRAVQGLGAGGLAVCASAVLADVVPLKDRARYQGALGAVFGVALVLGPLLGGLFTDHLSWRWVFLINLPLGVAVLALAARSIPRDRLGTRPTIDYSGIGLVSVGASALTLGLSWGGNEYAWSSMTILGLFALAAVAFAGFIAVEARASEPMLPLRLFRNPVFSVTVVLAFIVGFAMLGALTFLPTYSQYVKGVSPTASGLRTLPLVVSLLITSMVAGTVVSRTGRYKIFPLAGCAIMGVGLFMLSRLTPESSYLTLAIDMFVLGAGIGFAMQILTIIVQNASPFADLGVATSGVGFFRTLGSSFGTAIFGTIFTSSVTGPLHSALVKAQIPPAAASTPSELHRYPAHRIAPVVQAYSDSLQTVFLWAVPVAGLGVVLALFLKQTPVRATVQSGATDLGEGFGLPETGDRVITLERLASRAIRAAGADVGRRIAAAAGSSVSSAEAWCTAVVRGRERLGQPTDLAAIARRYGVPAGVLRPAFDRTRAAGLLAGPDDRLETTADGRTELARLGTAAKEWLATELADWHAAGDPAFDEALRRMGRRYVGEALATPAAA